MCSGGGEIVRQENDKETLRLVSEMREALRLQGESRPTSDGTRAAEAE